MKTYLFKTFVLLISTTLLISCGNDDPTPSGSGTGTKGSGGGGGGTTPSASAVVFGNTITFSSLSARSNLPGLILELETPVGQIIAIEIQEAEDERSYEISNFNVGYYVDEGGTNVFSSSNSASTGGFTISELNLVDNYISGTFSFNACMGQAFECVNVTNGKFNRVPYSQ